MNYTRIYNAIIIRAQQRVPIESYYYESHHITPRCISGDDSPDNLVKLTLREHFICHLLLTRMYSGAIQIKMKLAVSRMIPNVEKKCSRNRCYDHYRAKYYNNRVNYNTIKTVYNNMQSKRTTLMNKNTLQVSCIECKLINYTLMRNNRFQCSYCHGVMDSKTTRNITEITDNPICLCGCGNHTASKHAIWIKNHITKCACGCGKVKKVTQNLTSVNLYIHGHNRSDETNAKKSYNAKQRLSKLTREQMMARLQKSLLSGDNEKRKKSISDSKASIIKVIYPDDSHEFMLSNETSHKLGISWPAIRHILLNAAGFQSTTGYRYEWIKRFQFKV